MFKIGDKVKTDYKRDEMNVLRTITKIEKSPYYGSGYIASADSGEECPTCRRPFGTPIIDVDADWFEKI